METEQNSSTKRPTRWWPAVVILIGFFLSLIFIWSTGDDNQQFQVLWTLSTILISAILLVAWALFFSRLAKRIRLAIFGSLLGAGLLFGACFR